MKYKYSQHTPPAAGWVKTSALCKSLGITYRQLDHWVNRGLAVPSLDNKGSGYTRWWAPSDVEVLIDLVERIKACPFTHSEGPRK